MPNHHDDDCECADCRADNDRFWREQGEGEEDETPPHPDTFDLSDIDDQGDGPCSHLFNDDGRCELCGAEYNPVVHGHRIASGAMS